MVNTLIFIGQLICLGLLIKFALELEKYRKTINNHSEAILKTAEIVQALGDKNKGEHQVFLKDIEDCTDKIQSLAYDLEAIKKLMQTPKDTTLEEKVLKVEKCINVLAENIDHINQLMINPTANPIQEEMNKQFDLFNEWINGMDE